MQYLVALVTAAFLLAGCGGDSPSPDKGDTSTETPEAQSSPAQKAETYTTAAFLAGQMKVRLANDWIVSDDSAAHFAAAEGDDPDYSVLCSLDAYPVQNGERVKGVRATAEGLLAWLGTNENLRVMPKPDYPIGNDIRAKVADMRISDQAVNDDPSCPADVCVNPIAFPPSDETYGLAGHHAVIRFYLSDIEFQGTKHLLVVSVEGRNRHDLHAFLLGRSA